MPDSIGRLSFHFSVNCWGSGEMSKFKEKMKAANDKLTDTLHVGGGGKLESHPSWSVGLHEEIAGAKEEQEQLSARSKQLHNLSKRTREMAVASSLFSRLPNTPPSLTRGSQALLKLDDLASDWDAIEKQYAAQLEAFKILGKTCANLVKKTKHTADLLKKNDAHALTSQKEVDAECLQLESQIQQCRRDYAELMKSSEHEFLKAMHARFEMMTAEAARALADLGHGGEVEVEAFEVKAPPPIHRETKH